MNNALHIESNILTIDISEPCVSTARIWPCMAVSGSCGNANLHSLVCIIFPTFGSPTMIRVIFNVVCLWGLIFYISCLLASVYDIPVLGSTIVSGVDPTYLT